MILVGNQESKINDRSLKLECRTMPFNLLDCSKSLKSHSKCSTSTVAGSEVSSKTSSKESSVDEGSHDSAEDECDLSQYVRFTNIAIIFAS